VGVIAALEQSNMHPDLVVGTSAGSVVAALYACGMSATELEAAALSMEEATLTDWTLPFTNRGMLKGNALARYVNNQVHHRLIEQMRMPLGIVATDLANGKGVLFQRGDTGVAVRASSAVPGVFEPVEISGREYVDGGLVAPVPVAYALQMGAELVIAVDISNPPDANRATDAFKVLLQTFAIMGQTISRFELASAHVVVRPALAGVGSAAFSERQKSISAGRAAMQAALPLLRQRMAQLSVPLGR
jgi:NTE family protein